MKTKIKPSKPLIDAARIALQIPDLTQFMAEVGQRMDRREAAKKALVEPRKIQHS